MFKGKQKPLTKTTGKKPIVEISGSVLVKAGAHE